MQQPESQERRPFSAWLAAMAKLAGATRPSELQRLLAEHQCHCTKETVASWLEGTSEPSPAKMREAMVAVNKALPEVDAWEEYRRMTEGEKGPEVRQKAELEGAGELLDELIQRDPRLPPRLS